MDSGHAAFFEGVCVNFTSCSFENCSSGAVYIRNAQSDSTVRFCNFTDCVSACAGAVRYSDNEKLVISSSNFNRCISKGYGGAVYISECKNSRIISCDFTNCSSDNEGAAIYISNSIISDSLVESCNFTKCHYIQNNTALEAVSSKYNNTLVENCRFIDIYPVSVTASDLTMVYTSGSLFKVTVFGSDGRPADGVTVRIAGKISKTLTTKNGIAQFKVTQTPGTYKITVTALGKSLAKTITVKHLLTLKTATFKKSAKKLTLQASLAKVNGKYLKNKAVTFKINGKKVASARTNSKGIAKITIKNPDVVKKLKAGKKLTYQVTYLKDTVKKYAKLKK